MDATTSQHDQTGAPGAPDAHGAEEIRKHVKTYVMVFIALACLTAVTVGISYLHLGSKAINVAVALLIAGIKGSLVAAFFMHLISEKKVIFYVLALTALFFLFVMFIPLFIHLENGI